MVRKHVVTLSILVLFLATVSCTKIGQPTKPKGPLTYDTAKFTDAIPQEYGPLIGVTQNSADARWATLWFQRTDGTVAAVFVNVQEGKIGEKALTIPRR
jgi:hypothetical protein